MSLISSNRNCVSIKGKKQNMNLLFNWYCIVVFTKISVVLNLYYQYNTNRPFLKKNNCKQKSISQSHEPINKDGLRQGIVQW